MTTNIGHIFHGLWAMETMTSAFTHPGEKEAASFVFPGRAAFGVRMIVKARRVASWLQQQFHGSANNLSKKVTHLRGLLKDNLAECWLMNRVASL